MTWILFIVYLVLFSWLVLKVPFFKVENINNRTITILFLFKVLAAITYGIVMGQTYFKGRADTWQYHEESLKETQLLFQQPKVYLTNLFTNSYQEGYSKFLSTTNSYWNDLKFNSFVKLLSIFNVSSGGNYYTNAIFYSFLTFFGTMAFVKTMLKVFPDRLYSIIGCIVMIPSFVFWCNGIHKDGLIFTAISLFMYHFYVVAREKKVTLKNLFIIIFSLLIVLPLRNTLFLGLLHAAIAWVIAEKLPKRNISIFITVALFSVVSFFTSKYFYNINLPGIIAERQQEFLKLGGSSVIHITPLQPSFNGFIQNFPEAINHAFFRPYITEVKNSFYIPLFLEVAAFLLLAFFALLTAKKIKRIDNVILFSWMTSFVVLIVIGYVVPSLGAICRYRSITLPLLVTPLFCMVSFRKKMANIV